MNESLNYENFRDRLLKQYGKNRIRQDLSRHQLMNFFITGYYGRYLFYSLEGKPIKKADSNEESFLKKISFRPETKNTFFNEIENYLNDYNIYYSLTHLQYRRFTLFFLPLIGYIQHTTDMNSLIRNACDLSSNTYITKIPLSYCSYPFTALLIKHMKIGQKKGSENNKSVYVWSEMRKAIIGDISAFTAIKWKPNSKDKLGEYLNHNTDILKDVCEYTLDFLFPDSLYDLLENLLPDYANKEGIPQLVNFQHEAIDFFSKISLESVCLLDDFCFELKKHFVDYKTQTGCILDIQVMEDYCKDKLLPLYRRFLDEVYCDINLAFSTKFYSDK